MTERLQFILQHYQISPSRLAEKLGVQRSGISHILSGRNKPGFDFLVRLTEVFPEIDANWLLSGKGKPFGRMEDDSGQDLDKVSTVGTYGRSTIPEMRDLFSQPAEAKNEFKTPVNQENTSAPKSADPVVDEEQASDIVVLYKSGKFRHYRPR